MMTSKTVNDFINDVASSTPAPGGGSVAALAGTLGVALTSMVCNLTIGKKKYLDVQGEMEEVLKRSETLRASITKLIDEDTEAFNAVMSAMNLPKETEEQKTNRSGAIQLATKNATEIPLRLMQFCEDALRFTKITAEKGNVNSISDAGVAALMLHAACLGARLNVQINLGGLKDSVYVRESTSRAESVSQRVEAMSRDILERVNKSLSPALS
ncbi:MAG: cyclodeaminase/cyclohydrolase family protein [Bacteroidota bacterium]